MHPHNEPYGGHGEFGTPRTETFRQPPTELHAGLGRFMASVFGWMGAGLTVTAITAFITSTSPAYLQAVYGSGGFLPFVVTFAPLLFVWFLAGRLHQMDRPVAIGSFLAYSALMGVSLGPIPLIYSLGSLAGVFAVTAGMFAALAGLGFVTKRDLSPMGHFLYMAVIGLILASIVSYFVPGMSMMLSVLVVLVFAGLTAYDTQKIKQVYLMHGDQQNLGIYGALHLYLDFINIFLAMLRLFGGSRD